MDANLPGTFLLNGPSLGPFPEAKAPVCQYSVQSSFYKLGPAGLGAQLAAGTPHGISDILGRPAATPNSSLLPGYPHAGGFNGLSSPGVYYGPQVGALPKAGGEYLPRGRSCWAEAAPEWRGGRQCGGRKYRGLGAAGCWLGGWVPQVTGTLLSPEPSALGQGHVSFPLPCTRHSWLASRLAQDSGKDPSAGAAGPQTVTELFGSRAGAALMTNTNSLPPGSHSWQGQAEPSDSQDLSVSQTASLRVSAWLVHGRDRQDSQPRSPRLAALPSWW